MGSLVKIFNWEKVCQFMGWVCLIGGSVLTIFRSILIVVAKAEYYYIGCRVDVVSPSQPYKYMLHFFISNMIFVVILSAIFFAFAAIMHKLDALGQLSSVSSIAGAGSGVAGAFASDDEDVATMAEAQEEQEMVDMFSGGNTEPVADGFWKCPKCGKNNPPFFGTCSCGTSKV